ncbi:MAG: DUF1501 domain-containing protein [Bacteroidetes bacterium]|nr:DUF1501 domain-containing protein [Bacteroidota bacterium]
MKRRDFLGKSILAGISPVFIDGWSVKAMAENPLVQFLNKAGNDDRVFVLIQLNGGNDGLNTVIPIDQYSNLSNARSNIVIPENKVLTLSGNSATGLHPAMSEMKGLYDNGLLSIVQSVGYPNPDFSHFRATDIWLTGADSNQTLETGWMGRYLDTKYPKYPTNYPNTNFPDPPAIQIGALVSPALQGNAASLGMSITDPTSFYQFVSGTVDNAANTPAGHELTYLRLVAQQTQAYSGSILKTRVYVVNLGGFDTHSVQVSATGGTETGAHATLLQKISQAVNAFQDDLKQFGLQDRVMGMTFSEFGRRIKSNSSLGTDHGAAAPLFIFGSKVNGGVYGTNPIIPSIVSVNDNVPMQFDFRQIYATILKNWFEVSNEDINSILLKQYSTLNFINSSSSGLTESKESKIDFIDNYPNPVSSNTIIRFACSEGFVRIKLFDGIGREILTISEGNYHRGTHEVVLDASSLHNGNYYYLVQSEGKQMMKTMIVAK